MKPSLDILSQQSKIQNVNFLKLENECNWFANTHHEWHIAMTLTPWKDHILKEKCKIFKEQNGAELTTTCINDKCMQDIHAVPSSIGAVWSIS